MTIKLMNLSPVHYIPISAFFLQSCHRLRLSREMRSLSSSTPPNQSTLHSETTLIWRACTDLHGALALAQHLWTIKYAPLRKKSDTLVGSKQTHAILFQMWNEEGTDRRGNDCPEKLHMVSVERVWLDGKDVQLAPAPPKISKSTAVDTDLTNVHATNVHGEREA